MPDGYSRSPRLLKGALVELGEPFLGPIPNVVVFQYNPASFSREMTPWAPPTEDDAAGGEEPRTQPYDPGETFSLDLELDATDALEEPGSHPVAAVSGVADRIAAMEMLLYPRREEGGVGQFLSALGGGSAAAVPECTVPVVLFVWGPGRILPVRLTAFTVEEQAFSPTLYPVRAKVTVGMKVLTPAAFQRPGRELTQPESLAVAAYNFTRGQKELLARANLANSVESILGMLPF
ncbi:MAG: hypothetical protein RJQ04_02830 [Longimicrobiales bacterium]